MRFEWDPTKNESNKAKHNIGFEEASKVFDDVNCYTEKTNRKDEERYRVVGFIFDKLFTVVYTFRESIIRIISARRANRLEEKKYNERDS